MRCINLKIIFDESHDAPLVVVSRPNMAQAGGTQPENLKKVFPVLEKLLTK
jgi:hypothetical protein